MRRRIAASLVLVVLTTLATPAAAELYSWTDADGVRHYTSDRASIPEAYRAAARDIGSPRAPDGTAAAVTRPDDAGIMRFRSGAPVVATVLVNGVGLRLMVDTGADRTVLTQAAAARTGLGVDGGRQVRVLGVAGSAVASELAVTHVEVAGARVGPLRMLVLDTPTQQLDGLLGRDILDSFTLTVDGAAGRATLIPR